MRVKIPFDIRFKPWMLEGIKQYDPRTRIYGQPGDFFHVFGTVFQIKGISRFSLEAIASYGYREAGFNSPESFVDYWNEYHPIRGFRSHDVIYLHWFSLTDLTLANMTINNSWCPFCPIDYVPGIEIPCEHFIGYAGQVEPHPENVLIRTPVSARIYRQLREVSTACSSK